MTHPAGITDSLHMEATNTTLPLNEDQFTSPLNSTHTNDSALILQQLNDEKAQLYIPVVVYMAILLIIGTFGNIVAIIVYADVKKKSSADYFILCVSILDLLSCVVGMPAEIYDLSFPYMYYSSVACKILRYTQACTILASTHILVLVAFDRYFLICKINRTITASRVKKICIVIIVVSFVISTPTGVINGITPVETGIVGVTGYACLIEDSLRRTIYPALWYAFLMLVFVVTVVIISVLYIRISCQVWKRKKIATRRLSRVFQVASDITDSRAARTTTRSTSISESSDISTETGVTSAREISRNNIRTSDKTSNKDRADEATHKNATQNHPTRSTTINPLRTTLILFIVTLVFVLSFLPFLVVTVLRSVIRDYENSLNDVTEVVHKFCLRSYFINNSVNPLIYSFLNASFRRRVIKKLKCLWFCKKDKFQLKN